MAGVGRKNVRQRVLEDLLMVLPAAISRALLYLFHDGKSALWSALGKGFGIVVSAGTGSIAFGIDEEGRSARCGGWGRFAGDEGSAYWIAIQALTHIIRSLWTEEKLPLLSPG